MSARTCGSMISSARPLGTAMVEAPLHTDDAPMATCAAPDWAVDPSRKPSVTLGFRAGLLCSAWSPAGATAWPFDFDFLLPDEPIVSMSNWGT